MHPACILQSETAGARGKAVAAAKEEPAQYVVTHHTTAPPRHLDVTLSKPHPTPFLLRPGDPSRFGFALGACYPASGGFVLCNSDAAPFFLPRACKTVWPSPIIIIFSILKADASSPRWREWTPKRRNRTFQRRDWRKRGCDLVNCGDRGSKVPSPAPLLRCDGQRVESSEVGGSASYDGEVSQF